MDSGPHDHRKGRASVVALVPIRISFSSISFAFAMLDVGSYIEPCKLTSNPTSTDNLSLASLPLLLAEFDPSARSRG